MVPLSSGTKGLNIDFQFPPLKKTKVESTNAATYGAYKGFTRLLYVPRRISHFQRVENPPLPKKKRKRKKCKYPTKTFR